MLVILIGMASAIIFGAADFLGGLAAKRLAPIAVTAIAALTGLVVLALGSLALPGEWSGEALLFGALSGVAGAISIVTLYACLAIGPMSILAPTMAVISAIIPAVAEALRGHQLPPWSYLACALVLVAAVLVGFVPEKDAVRPSARALLLAVVAGVMIGAFLILIDLTPADSGLTPLIANRATNAAITTSAVGLLALARARRPDRPLAPVASLRPGVLLAVFGGAIDAVANSLMLLGMRLGDLTTISVLIALSPAGTAILAAIVLRERVARVQVAGIVLAILASALFTLP